MIYVLLTQGQFPFYFFIPTFAARKTTFGLGLMQKSLIFFSFLFFILFGCQQKSSLLEEYRELAKSSEKMDGTTFWIVDSTQSFIQFQVSQSADFALSGKIPIGKGTLLVEKERILAGFFEGKLSDCKIEENKKNIDLDKELKTLKDSLPRLFSKEGNIVRLDLVQGGKQIIRTGYREALPPGIDPNCTHMFQVKCEFADSVLTLPLASKINQEKNKIEFQASSNIGYQDFGVFYKRLPGGFSSIWMPQIPCQIKVVYKPFKP